MATTQMARVGNFVFTVFFALSISALPTTTATECTWSKYNFTSLSGYPWLVYAENGTSLPHYKISVCGPLASPIEAPCKNNVAVCRYDSTNSEAEAIGKTGATLNITENAPLHELVLHMEGTACSQVPGQKYKSIINFKCGKTLGSPVYIESNQCETYFEWYTSVACTKATTAKYEVRCHVYDGDGKKRDLSPLIKLSGGHLVESADDVGDFYINVCRDITPQEQGTTTLCPDSAGACVVKDGVGNAGGHPSGQLQLTTDGKLLLTYDESPLLGCSTHISFICPQRGQSHGPRLTANLGCQFYVEWITEYACPEQTLVSHTCSLNMDQHNIEFDLTPLTVASGSDETYQVPNDGYVYYLNICDEVGIACPDDDHKEGIVGCQLKEDEPSFGKSLGKIDRQTLRYSDNQLTLIYQGGNGCSSGFQRTTVINFHCPADKPDGELIGEPVISSDEDCIYVFDWDTTYACPEYNFDLDCTTRSGENEYDLGPLTRFGPDADNWNTMSDGDSYYINVCSNLLSKPSTANCPDGSAICVQESSGSYKGLGRYEACPVYSSSTKTIHLHYEEGDVCENYPDRKIDSIITLRCRPGHLGSPPSFVRKTHDGCTYEFEWETAAACVLKHKTGDDCKVFDDDAGFSFDLSPLKKDGDNDTFYRVVPDPSLGSNMEYFINVCAPVSGTDCNIESSDVASCQADRNSPTSNHHIAGLANDNLLYYDGMINLTYTDGELYHNPAVPRKTQIMFICDPDAGDGTPTYLVESNHTYSFEWRTRHACIEIPTECAVTNPTSGKHYDLFSLTRQNDNWDVEVDRMKYYINICRHVNPIPLDNGCSPEAAACATHFQNAEEFIMYSSIGQVKSAPTVVEEGTILLNYTDGMMCNEDAGVRYNTLIYLHCDHTQLNSEPQFSVRQGCTITFNWNTVAACPVGSTDGTTNPQPSDTCTIQAQNSDYIFNLKPLQKKPTDAYDVPGTESGKIYKVNICGEVEGCGQVNNKAPAVCDGSTAIAATSSTLEFTETGQLMLKYVGGRSNGNLVEARIEFICSKTVPQGTPVFKEKDGSTYIFEFTTSLVCPPEPVDCHTTDSQGHEYDLNALAKTDGNYVVPDTDRPNLMYYINLCRPINQQAENASCPGGPIGGCQIASSGEEKEFNMGYIQSKPVAYTTGEITMRYLGGSLCHEGTEHENYRSTRITMYCSEVQEDPKFEGETPECEYSFSWRTPSACPQIGVVGSDCQVTEPLYNQVFNFNLLHKQGDYSVSSGEFTYLLNVCAPLTTGTGECEDVGVCQTKSGSVLNAGKANGNITYHDGVFSLTYKEGHGDCHGQYDRTSHIEFTCDHNNFGSKTGPRYINESSSCQYNFEWPTSLACQRFSHGRCTVEKDGQVYDLSQLTRTSDNHQVDGPDGTKYIINVCTTIVHKKDVTCPPGSAACLIDLNETDKTKKYKSIGEPSDDELSFDAEGNLVLTYDSTLSCSLPDHHRKTVITFTCNHDKIDEKPWFSSIEDGNCTHKFIWETAEACPVNSDSGAATGHCSATNPQTGHTFDLTSWKKSDGYMVPDHHGHTFWVNICDDMDNSPCGDGIGSCQVSDDNSDDHWNAGKADDHVYYEDGLLVLNYTDGKLCRHSNTLRNTVINFVCGAPGTEKGVPVYIDESDDCTYYITWNTEDVCEEELNCEVEDNEGNILDLSPLLKSDGYHLALTTLADEDDPDATFYISVCRPLNAIPNIMCPPGSAACRVKDGETPTSLGRVSKPPTYESFSKEVIIEYDRGDKMPSGENFSAKIILSCERGPSLGQPKLELIDGGKYVFNWATNVVCPPADMITTTDCHYTDPRTTYKYDLSALSKTSSGEQSYQVPSQSGKGTYYLNVCADLTEAAPKNAGCGDASVCAVSSQNEATSYGVTAGQGYQMEGDVLKMSYKQGASCPESTRKRASYIRFICNRDMQDLGMPQLFSESECDVVFSWDTPLACPPLINDCALSHDGDNFDLKLLSRETSSWQVTDANSNRYWLNICQSVHDGPDRTQCSSNAAACRELSDGSIDMLGTVQTQKMSMADDGSTIIVRYSQGSNACAAKRRSNSMAAVTEIHFKCGSGIGMPKVLPRKGDTDSCLFQFEWITHVACKDTREPVTAKDHKITDPKSGVTVDLTKLMDEVVSDFPGPDGTHFSFSMTGSSSDSTCSGAAICWKATNPVIIGQADTLQYFMEDDVLELVYDSTHPCETESGKLTSSIVQVECSEETSMQFVYKSRSCEYLFHRSTPNFCEKFKLTTLPEESGDNVKRSNTVGIVFGVLFLILSLAVLAIVFHSRERRAKFASRMKRVFGRNIVGRSMAYTQLRSDDSEDTLLGGAAVLPTFHEDSDEDLIL